MNRRNFTIILTTALLAPLFPNIVVAASSAVGSIILFFSAIYFSIGTLLTATTVWVIFFLVERGTIISSKVKLPILLVLPGFIWLSLFNVYTYVEQIYIHPSAINPYSFRVSLESLFKTTLHPIIVYPSLLILLFVIAIFIRFRGRSFFSSNLTLIILSIFLVRSVLYIFIPIADATALATKTCTIAVSYYTYGRCISKPARETGNVSLCDQVSDERERDGCYRDLETKFLEDFEYSGMPLNKDLLSVCLKMKSHVWQPECIRNYAISSGDATVCENTRPGQYQTEVDAKGYCYAQVALYQKKMDICSLPTDFNVQKSCKGQYDWLAPNN